MIRLGQIRREMKPLLRLAVPIVMGEVGWMSMQFVDIAMIGRVGPDALAAVSVGSAVFLVFAIVCEGMLLGTDSIISQDFGAGRVPECFRTLWAGVQLALPLGVLCALMVAACARLLAPIGIAPGIARQTIPFLYAMACGLPALMGFVAMRVFLQGTHRVKVVAFAMISANIVNFAGNYALIYGHFGLPAMGATGSGISTTLSRCYMACVLLGYMSWRNRREHWQVLQYARQTYFDRIWKIVRLGAPAAAQIALEVGIFSASTLVAGRLGAVAVSGHQIALVMASLTFMVPLGIAQATSVRVGNSIGRRDAEAANVSGWSGVLLSASFMSCSAVVLWTWPLAIVHIFTWDPAIAKVGVSLLAIAAVFQFFDGVQVTAIGALRGSGNTRIAMITDLVGWWLVGLPLGAWLCFERGWGVRGLWVGLSAGLISIGCVLAVAWCRRVEWLRRKLAGAVAGDNSVNL
ncbi:MAG TPA: MATE family efflux transporter [Candidatus Saccharimonadales bacterium]|nr:MATE family efflux transporter [Candidatus Saccharimonadales bacterium]